MSMPRYLRRKSSLTKLDKTYQVYKTLTLDHSGSSHNAVRIFSTKDVAPDASRSTPLSTIEPFNSGGSSSFLHGGGVLASHMRVGGGGGAAATTPISATAFHPHRMMLACSSVNDGHVSLFRCRSRDGREGLAAGKDRDREVEE